MQVIESNHRERVYRVPVEFTLFPHKQPLLIDILYRYSPLELEELSVLLSIPIKHLAQALRGEYCLNKTEVFQLVKHFCICCGQ